jgi:hypothetical protein
MPYKPFANTTKVASGVFHTGDPREKCVSVNDINYVSLSEYNPTTSNSEKTEDDWWNNEITD